MYYEYRTFFLLLFPWRMNDDDEGGFCAFNIAGKSSLHYSMDIIFVIKLFDWCFERYINKIIFFYFYFWFGDF